jgi:hypothetical protein
MSERDAHIFADILEGIERGEVTLEEEMERHPKLKNELAGLLEAVQLYQNVPTPAPIPRFRSTARARILSHMIAQEPVTFRGWLRRILQNTISTYERRPGMSIILVVTLILSLFGGGTVYASQASLPGDLLYPVKLIVEDTLLGLSPEGRAADLSGKYAGERVEELHGLIGQQRYEEIPAAMRRYQVHAEGARAEALTVHVEVLSGLLAVVPEQAQQAIEKAIEASQKYAELPAEVPAGLPPEVPADLPPAVPGDVPPVTLPIVPPVELPSVPPVVEPPVPPVEAPPGVPSQPPAPPAPVTPPTVPGGRP